MQKLFIGLFLLSCGLIATGVSVAHEASLIFHQATRAPRYNLYSRGEVESARISSGGLHLLLGAGGELMMAKRVIP